MTLKKLLLLLTCVTPILSASSNDDSSSIYSPLTYTSTSAIPSTGSTPPPSSTPSYSPTPPHRGLLRFHTPRERSWFIIGAGTALASWTTRSLYNKYKKKRPIKQLSNQSFAEFRAGNLTGATHLFAAHAEKMRPSLTKPAELNQHLDYQELALKNLVQQVAPYWHTLAIKAKENDLKNAQKGRKNDAQKSQRAINIINDYTKEALNTLQEIPLRVKNLTSNVATQDTTSHIAHTAFEQFKKNDSFGLSATFTKAVQEKLSTTLSTAELHHFVDAQSIVCANIIKDIAPDWLKLATHEAEQQAQSLKAKPAEYRAFIEHYVRNAFQSLNNIQHKVQEYAQFTAIRKPQLIISETRSVGSLQTIPAPTVQTPLHTEKTKLNTATNPKIEKTNTIDSNYTQKQEATINNNHPAQTNKLSALTPQ